MHELHNRKTSVASRLGIPRSTDEGGCAQQVLLPTSFSFEVRLGMK